MEQNRSKNVYIGVIGCGDIANYHIKAYDKNEYAKLVAFCDIEEKKALKFAEQYGTEHRIDYRELLENIEKLDAISICTPPVSHKEIAVAALKKNVNVLCEKPLAINAAEAEEMVDAAAESSAFLMTAYPFRFREEMLKTKQLLEKGTIGTPLFAHNSFSFLVEDIHQRWFTKKEISGGGIIIDNGSHATDIFHFLFGEIADVAARATIHDPRNKVEDNALILLGMKNGLYGTIELSWSVPFPEEDYLEIYGSSGTITVSSGYARYRNSDSKQWVYIQTDPAFQAGFDNEIDHFIHCIRNKKQPRSTGADGLKALQVIEKIYSSLK